MIDILRAIRETYHYMKFCYYIAYYRTDTLTSKREKKMRDAFFKSGSHYQESAMELLNPMLHK